MVIRDDLNSHSAGTFLGISVPSGAFLDLEVQAASAVDCERLLREALDKGLRVEQRSAKGWVTIGEDACCLSLALPPGFDFEEFMHKRAPRTTRFEIAVPGEVTVGE